MTEPRTPKVVIVGGGFGGLTVARHLQTKNVHLTLVDKRSYHLFQPLLYQVATAGLPETSIAMPIRSVLKSNKCEVLLAEAVGASLDRRRLQLKNGRELPYDYLVLAAGATTTWFGNHQWSQQAYGLKDVEDAIHLRERLLLCFEAAERTHDPQRRRRLLTFVVVGGGPTGVELAGAIAELGRLVLSDEYRHINREDVKVILLQKDPHLLIPFDRTLSERAKQDLEQMGVEVRLGAGVVQISEDGAAIVKSDDGGEQCIRAGAVCWAPGVQPVDLGKQLNVAQERGQILVNETCSLPEHPEVFCIGDLARCTPQGHDEPVPGLAAVAVQQGKYVAHCIARDLRGKPRDSFRYKDKGIMATIGSKKAVVQSGRLRLCGLLAWLVWSVTHIFFLIGFRNRLLVFLDWCWQYFTARRGARLIIGFKQEPDPNETSAGQTSSEEPLQNTPT